MEQDTLIKIQDLKVHFPIEKGLFFKKVVAQVRAVDGLDFTIQKGETLGLVGESGCGKSTTGRALLQLLRPTYGKVLFENRDLTRLGGSELRNARRNFQMIFHQEARKNQHLKPMQLMLIMIFLQDKDLLISLKIKRLLY